MKNNKWNQYKDMKHAAKLVEKITLSEKKSLTYLIKYLYISVQFCSVQCNANTMKMLQGTY